MTTILQRSIMQKAVASRPWMLLGMVTTTTAFPTATTATTTLCEDKDSSFFKKDENGSIEWGKTVAQMQDEAFWDHVAQKAGSKVQGLVDSGVPTQLSYGFLSGYCSGYALKKIGKTAAVVLGLGFMSLQTLSYYGYIKVDHVQIKKGVEGLLDVNEDGKVDRTDVSLMTGKVLEVLQFNLPAGAGFAGGFFGGLRSG